MIHHWTDAATVAKFRADWNGEMTMCDLSAAWHLSRKTLVSRAVVLRHEGVELRSRGRGREGRTWITKKMAAHLARIKRADPDLAMGRPMPGSVLQPATIYDAAGRVVGRMNPYTREREHVS